MGGCMMRTAAGAAIVLAGCCKKPTPLSSPELPVSIEPAPVAVPARCVQLGKDLVLGPEQGREDEESQGFIPFATEVGRGAAHDRGFAIGALTREDKGTDAVVALLSGDGSTSRVLSLGALHGDADPPRVFASGGTVGVAVLQPAGASRTLRLARVDGGSVVWGAEFQQGNDEPLGYDVVLAEKRGIAVWDDIPTGREVSGIFVATFEPNAFTAQGIPRLATLPGTDADEPRLVRRGGGAWLFWIARRPEDSDYDARYRAEDIAYKWIEVVPLDDQGQVSGTARRISSHDGHVLAYDVTEGSDGSALVVWRDDDTPSGSPGGRLLRALVRMGGVDGPDVIDDEHLGVGAPNVSPGWVAIADATNPTRLAPMAPNGTPLDAWMSEPLIGPGEPEAANNDVLLISRPAGLAMRLVVAKCNRRVPDAGGIDAESKQR